MHFTSFIAPALLLLADMTSAKAIMHLPSTMRRRDYSHEMKRAADKIMRREPQSQDGNLQPQTFNGLGSLSVSEPDATLNRSIGTACTDALSSLTGVKNDAGLTACYNILQYDDTPGSFEADLRLYQAFEPKGSFANITVNDIQISLTFPSATTFQSLTKRKRDVVERQASSMNEIQQYTLVGSFLKNLELKKLNNTQIMSLMLPDIKLNMADSDKAVSANITADEGAWFIIGKFSSDFNKDLVTPVAAKEAIATALPFVLPGVTLGIFPTGLIVTLAWTVIFFLAYGFGTLGRIKYREAYRKRKAAQMGRTGKKI